MAHPHFFTTPESLAKVAGVTAETIRRSIREGNLKAESKGRSYLIRDTWAKDYIEKRGIPYDEAKLCVIMFNPSDEQAQDLNKENNRKIDSQDNNKVTKLHIPYLDQSNGNISSMINEVVGIAVGTALATYHEKCTEDIRKNNRNIECKEVDHRLGKSIGQAIGTAMAYVFSSK